MILDAYRNKRVLITGHTGFKGSWLSQWLKMLGADVLGYALPPETERDHFNLLKLSDAIEHVEGDVRDAAKLLSTVQHFQPEIVFHLAAQPLVRLSYADPKLTMDTNVGGAVNLLEAVRQTPTVRSLVFITSDKSYKNKEWTWGYRESDELGGHDPYSASKAAAEMVFQGYWLSYFQNRDSLGAAVTRAGNVIGGGDWSKDRIVPDCARAFLTNQPIELRRPESTRPWQHVLEPLGGYLLLGLRLLENPKRWNGAWNFGPNGENAQTVHSLVQLLVETWGRGKIVVNKSGSELHEAGLLQLNCDKARYELGWAPQMDFHQTVSETAMWYKSFASQTNMKQVTEQQIRDYQSKFEERIGPRQRR